ncbi:MAG: hypothetical protein RL220_1970 [Bacteroidota bacterium]
MLSLLLFFCVPVFSFPLVSDTIIIDGEYIAIMRDSSSADVDSLEEQWHKRKEKLNLDVGVSLLPGITLSNIYRPESEDVLLKRMIGKGISAKPSMSIGAGATKHFSDLIALRLGVNYTMSSIKNPYLLEEDLSQEETYAFVSFEEGKLSQIVNVFIDPGYELDTIDLDIREGLFRFSSTDVILRMAVYPEPLKEELRMYVHFGPFVRFTSVSETSPVSLIANNTELINIPSDDLKFRNLMVGGTLGFGLEYEENDHVFGASLDGWVPAGLMNEYSGIEIISGSLSIGLHYAYRF